MFLSWADVSVAGAKRLTGSGLRACGLDHISAPALTALTTGSGLPELADLRLGLQWNTPDDPLPDRLRGALESGAFPRLTSLTLCDTRQSRSGDDPAVEGMGDRLAKSLASCTAVTRVGELILDPPLTRAGATALAASCHLDGLRVLKARVWPADRAAERALTDRFGRRVSLDVTSREY
ncbi:MAG TPA: hypothetical protein VH092_28775 [Urbifossiella sp.]|nr:hypothetical protein [Urbifossiella sp.]